MLHNHNNSILNLENNEAVAFIPTGGSQLKHYIEKKYLDGLLQSQVHIYDSDKQEYINSVIALNAEGNLNKVGFNTKKPELENYLHHEAINECYKSQNIEINLTEIRDIDDVPEKVAIAVHNASGGDWNSINPDPIKNEEKQKKKISRVKRQLNMTAVEKMTIDRLRNRGGYDEIKSWLDTISEFVN